MKNASAVAPSSPKTLEYILFSISISRDLKVGPGPFGSKLVTRPKCKSPGVGKVCKCGGGGGDDDGGGKVFP